MKEQFVKNTKILKIINIILLIFLQIIKEIETSFALNFGSMI